ncbi:LuxR family transcriptional regulator [Mycobacterium paragordonae]|nr:LuxR family transcriptional regulator [Mycobacterium paragordonae]
MLASMTGTDPRVELNWSDVLPTGTVTLLLADVEGSTRLWESQPEEMTAAFARLDRTLADLVVAHGGARPVEQGEGDSFVLAFTRASDAVGCALALQRIPLAPIRLRIGVHTGEVQLRDEGNYIGPTINKTARLRDLAHGGQTVLSGATESMAEDFLPADAWLNDLGSYELRGVARPERVVQLCHPDLCNEFPPLRTAKSPAAEHLPVQLTSFVGRVTEIGEVRHLLTGDRLVTLTGAGGAGKTRLAVQVAGGLAAEFGDGVWYVDLAPITGPELVPVVVGRALGMSDQQGRPQVEAIARFVADRRMLVVLDNCEHLLDACAELVVGLLSGCPGLTLLATSREPIGLPGEVTWKIPSMSLTGEAIELFADRARRVRPEFTMTDENAGAVYEICRRLDGMPLAIELAAARVRALSLDEIVGSLHDRFRLLTGGSRISVRRQQTLRASVDWSHALLTESERVLFRRLAVFLGGFDLDAAQAVAAVSAVERYQVLDQLTLLVDKSLVVAENVGQRTRYRLLETVRQYAQERLGESGESDAVRGSHRDHYAAMATRLDAPAATGHQQRVDQVETEIDNLRAAFAWSRDNSEVDKALQIASSLQPLWLTRGRVGEGLSWIDAVLGELDTVRSEVQPEVLARALADGAMFDGWIGTQDRVDQAREALAIARQLDDPALLVRALTACCGTAAFSREEAAGYFTEAITLARALGDKWRLSQLLGFYAYAALMGGDPIAARAAGEEGRELADAIGDRFASGQCRGWGIAASRAWLGDLPGGIAEMAELISEAEAAGDTLSRFNGCMIQSFCLGWHGEPAAALAAAEASIDAAAGLGDLIQGLGYLNLSAAHLAAGDVAATRDAIAKGHSRIPQGVFVTTNMIWIAETELAAGDPVAALPYADRAVSGTTGFFQMKALIVRARVMWALGDVEAAERDAHQALSRAAETRVHLGVPDIFDFLAALAADAQRYPEAARLVGVAAAIRQRTGEQPYEIYRAHHEALLAEIRDTLGQNDFDTAWAEGNGLSLEEAISYAQRGRGERKRPSKGWASLTPTELDVVRLVTEGLANKDVATRLFISRRTVETHLTHIYTKLNLTSRVQLVQEAARHR